MTMETSATVATIVLKNAPSVALGDFTPKPTAITEGQTEASAGVWTSVNGQFEAGIWEATPGSFTATREGYHEICQILSGRTTIEVVGEESIELVAGDTLVMPSGWVGTWHVHETVRKTFVVINEAPPAA
jgi:uncharacterized protein